MLEKLRFNFIALNMALATLVLVVVFSAICHLEHQSSVSEVLDELEIALDRSEADASPAGRPLIGKHPDEGPAHLPIAVYRIGEDGDYAQTGVSNATISEAVIEIACREAASSEAERGHLGEAGLYFAKRSTPEGTLVAFADEGAVSSWQGLSATLLLVGVVALAAFFLISIFFSRWTLRPVEHAWNQQKQFVADASHELKTPLTVILANTAILRSHPRDTFADQRQWVESAQVEALRMQDLVNDMLELARPDDDRASAETAFSVVDPSDLVENLALQFESVAFERNVELDCEVEGNVRVKGLEKRLERLVSTLHDNVCKYARASSSVRVTLSASEREATFRVVNDGSFIAKEVLPARLRPLLPRRQGAQRRCRRVRTRLGHRARGCPRTRREHHREQHPRRGHRVSRHHTVDHGRLTRGHAPGPDAARMSGRPTPTQPRRQPHRSKTRARFCLDEAHAGKRTARRAHRPPSVTTRKEKHLEHHRTRRRSPVPSGKRRP